MEDARIFDFDLSGGSLFYSRRIGARAPRQRPRRAPTSWTRRTRPPSSVPPSSPAAPAAGLSVGALGGGHRPGGGRGVLPRPTTPSASSSPSPAPSTACCGCSRSCAAARRWWGASLTALHRELPADGSFDFLPARAFSTGVDFEHTWSERALGALGLPRRKPRAGRRGGDDRACSVQQPLLPAPRRVPAGRRLLRHLHDGRRVEAAARPAQRPCTGRDPSGRRSARRASRRTTSASSAAASASTAAFRVEYQEITPGAASSATTELPIQHLPQLPARGAPRAPLLGRVGTRPQARDRPPRRPKPPS